MASSRIWITGAGGLIGSWLTRTASQSAPSWAEVVGLTHAQIELTDAAAVRAAFRCQSPQLIIHCAALSRGPECEANPALARLLNVGITRTLSELAADIPLVFFSTDLIFDGRTGGYDESAQPNPINVYGETKAAAERIVLANPRHTVIRTSLNAGPSPQGDRSFDEQMRRAWASGRVLQLFTDEFRCPLAAEMTARAVWDLVKQGASGIYHIAGSERLSRWQIGQLLAARCPELHPQIQAGSLSEYAGPPRCPDTSMNCAKAQRLLSFPLPRFSDWLADHPPAPPIAGSAAGRA